MPFRDKFFMKKLLFSLCLLLCMQVRAQVSLSVAPGRLFFDVNNTKRTDKIKVFNNGKTATTWQVSLQDWTRDSIGQKHFFPPGTQAHSCARDISFAPAVLIIPPDSNAEITVSVNNIAGLTANDTARNAMVVISQAEDPAALKQLSQKQAAIEIKAEFAVHVYLFNGASERSFGITDFYLDEDSTARLQVYVRNTGRQPLDTKTAIELSDKATGKEWKLEEQPAAILPGDKRISSFILPKDLPRGSFLALAIVHCGDDMPVKVGELSFDWNP